MHFADHAALEKAGRPFRCSACTPQIAKLRRCKQDRFDFGPEADPNVFPIRITPGGSPFGFCPAKATWDEEAAELWGQAMLSYEMKMPYTAGGLMQQPAWWVDAMADFVRLYEPAKFFSRARAVLGDGKPKGGNKAGASRHGRNR